MPFLTTLSAAYTIQRRGWSNSKTVMAAETRSFRRKHVPVTLLSTLSHTQTGLKSKSALREEAFWLYHSANITNIYHTHLKVSSWGISLSTTALHYLSTYIACRSFNFTPGCTESTTCTYRDLKIFCLRWTLMYYTSDIACGNYLIR